MWNAENKEKGNKALAEMFKGKIQARTKVKAAL
jgi:hypothetical protein